MTNNNHDTLMALLKENDADQADKIRSNNDRLFFLNNQLQRYGVPRCFNLEDAEAAISKVRAANKGGAA